LNHVFVNCSSIVSGKYKTLDIGNNGIATAQISNLLQDSARFLGQRRNLLDFGFLRTPSGLMMAARSSIMSLGFAEDLFEGRIVPRLLEQRQPTVPVGLGRGTLCHRLQDEGLIPSGLSLKVLTQ
jgi:hypothetical protein